MSTEPNAAQAVAEAADPGGPEAFSFDEAGYAAELAVFLERVAVRPDIQRWHGVALEMLGLRPGQTVLEAGCGVGVVARDLARMVGPHGVVVALDLSQLIITE